MVGAINPNATQTLDEQTQSAKQANLKLAPGEPMPKEGGSTATATPSPGASSSVPSPPPISHVHNHELSTAAVAGIAVGAAAFLIICAALFFFSGTIEAAQGDCTTP